MFDWNDLRYFLAVAHSGSIGTAAKALGRKFSPPFSAGYGALEAALDCSLARRQAGGYRLTTHGQQLLAYANHRLKQPSGACNASRATLDTAPSGPVKLTSHVTVGQRIIKSGFLDKFSFESSGYHG